MRARVLVPAGRARSLAVGVLVLGALTAGCLPAAPGPRPASPGPSAAPSPAAVAAGEKPERVVVESVTDGDTLRVTGGRRIRVLGIDSCETGTPGGARATAAARAAVDRQPVTLTREPTVDRDRYGRELRYVSSAGGDLGELMVAGDHTAVYAGRNDASPAYVARLRALDGNGRDCGGPAPSTGPSPAPSTSGASTLPAPAVAPSAPAPADGFASCAQARAAGAAPLSRGAPGYRSALDGDGDGVACEGG